MSLREGSAFKRGRYLIGTLPLIRIRTCARVVLKGLKGKGLIVWAGVDEDSDLGLFNDFESIATYRSDFQMS